MVVPFLLGLSAQQINDGGVQRVSESAAFVQIHPITSRPEQCYSLVGPSTSQFNSGAIGGRLAPLVLRSGAELRSGVNFWQRHGNPRIAHPRQDGRLLSELSFDLNLETGVISVPHRCRAMR